MGIRKDTPTLLITGNHVYVNYVNCVSCPE